MLEAKQRNVFRRVRNVDSSVPIELLPSSQTQADLSNTHSKLNYKINASKIKFAVLGNRPISKKSSQISYRPETALRQTPLDMQKSFKKVKAKPAKSSSQGKLLTLKSLKPSRKKLIDSSKGEKKSSMKL